MTSRSKIIKSQKVDVLSYLERRLGGGEAFLALGDLERERLGDLLLRREPAGDGERSIDLGIGYLKFK